MKRLHESTDGEPAREKMVVLEDEGPQENGHVKIECRLWGHGVEAFDSIDAYERHYAERHVNKCSICGKNFPLEYWLSLHITECHDSWTQALRARGDATVQCLMEGCAEVWRSPKQRRRHCITQHGFRRDFDFSVIFKGINGRNSLLVRSHDIVDENNSTQDTRIRQTYAHRFHCIPTQSVDQHQPEYGAEPEDELTNCLSALSLVPRSVIRNTFTAKRQH